MVTTTTAPVDSTGRTKKSSGAAALAKNKMEAPGARFAEWRAGSGERWGVARAKMEEKFARMGASVKYGVFSLTHFAHPVRRKAAKESEHQQKGLAADRRVQKEAAVHSLAAAKRARAKEERIATLNQAVH